MYGQCCHHLHTMERSLALQTVVLLRPLNSMIISHCRFCCGVCLAQQASSFLDALISPLVNTVQLEMSNLRRFAASPAPSCAQR